MDDIQPGAAMMEVGASDASEARANQAQAEVPTFDTSTTIVIRGNTTH